MANPTSVHDLKGQAGGAQTVGRKEMRLMPMSHTMLVCIIDWNELGQSQKQYSREGQQRLSSLRKAGRP